MVVVVGRSLVSMTHEPLSGVPVSEGYYLSAIGMSCGFIKVDLGPAVVSPYLIERFIFIPFACPRIQKQILLRELPDDVSPNDVQGGITQRHGQLAAFFCGFPVRGTGKRPLDDYSPVQRPAAFHQDSAYLARPPTARPGSFALSIG